MPTTFGNHAAPDAQETPIRGGEAVDITAADSTPTVRLCSRGLWVGGAGAVKVDLADGSTVTFSGITAGTHLRANVTKVYKTGTTATLMLYTF